MSTSTPLMGLTTPSANDTDYPTSVSDSFTVIDSHDHSTGKGTQIVTAGIANNAVTKAKLAADVAPPVGLISAWSTGTAPTGWLVCDGSAVSRVTYADLYSVIVDTAGSGDGSTTFNVPDFRGRFLRHVDGSANRDPDKASRPAMNSGGNANNNVFSVQTSEIGPHTHTQNAHTHTAAHNHGSGGLGTTVAGAHSHGLGTRDLIAAHGGAFGASSGSGAFPGDDAAFFTFSADTGHDHVISGNTATANLTTDGTVAVNNNNSGNESRPPNANVYFIIKY